MRRRVSRIARRSLAVSGRKLAAVRRGDRRHRRTHGVAWNVEEATVANDVVFTSTFDGTVYGLSVHDGRVLWHAKLRAGVNSCPAIAGDQLVIGAGVPRQGAVEELVSFEPS